MTDFSFSSSKIIAVCDHSHEIKRHLLVGRKFMIKLNSILKSIHITLPAKLCIVKAIDFTVVMYVCESWTIKKAECWRIDFFFFFQLWYWKRLMKIPWAPRRSKQPMLKEIRPEYSLEGLMLKLKHQYSGYLMQRISSLEKTLMLGKIETGGDGDDREWDIWMPSPNRWT